MPWPAWMPTGVYSNQQSTQPSSQTPMGQMGSELNYTFAPGRPAFWVPWQLVELQVGWVLPPHRSV